MMFKIKLVVALLMIGFFQLHADELMYKKCDWNANPKIHELTPEEKEDNYTVLKEKYLLDFVYEPSGELVLYETRHVIIHFNNEKGIEEMKKGKLCVFLIPVSTSTKLFHEWIKPNATEIEFLKGRIKFGKLDKNGNFYIQLNAKGKEQSGTKDSMIVVFDGRS